MTGWSLLQEQETAEREEIDHLDFTPGCEFPGGCDRHATHLARCRRCGHSSLACEPHVAETIRRLESAPAWILVVCLECPATVPARRWRELTEFVPLGGA